MKIDILTGKSEEHLTPCGSYLIHKDVLSPFQTLRENAKKEGFELSIASSFRSFERQLTIWNEKVEGKRPILDDQEKPLDINDLSNEEILFAILRWSALPGTSRHHWGTDLDVYDKASLPTSNYQLQLTQEESECYFSNFHRWLDDNSNDFYRPYCGGKPKNYEPWHISYRPVAEKFQGELTSEILRKLIVDAPILLKEEILNHIEAIHCQLS